MPYEMIALLMFSTMMLMLLTGQRVFGAIGAVAAASALLLWGDAGGADIPFSAAMNINIIQPCPQDKLIPMKALPTIAAYAVLMAIKG